ncbi:hypothetical protein EAX61_08100 [Dokdonia sinensis]|uniref:STAS/SEC14 domain-containing protein n=1 Tax=Dokdonia sinensis TaxID=2479847 RepID=A0A3M0GQI0_9FLAO|nr:hypothetical protein [Dokdonia sinensis]RMB59536.1 hypothetical protein EAX61_08100 [Dokdonia sinensis]
MIKHYHLEVSEVFIYDNFLVNQIYEGQDIQPHHNNLLKTIIQEHFASSPLIYISNRLHSYSVNPLIYIEAGHITNLVAMAMVIHDDEQRRMAMFEKTFFKKPFKIFENLTEAIVWSKQELTKFQTQNTKN